MRKLCLLLATSWLLALFTQEILVFSNPNNSNTQQKELLIIAENWIKNNPPSSKEDLKPSIPVGKSTIACNRLLLEGARTDCNLLILYPKARLDTNYVTNLVSVLANPCKSVAHLPNPEQDLVKHKFKCASNERHTFKFTILEKQVIRHENPDGSVDNTFIELHKTSQEGSNDAIHSY